MRKLSKRTIEPDILKKPARGRPKNKFISHKNFWCIPCYDFCDSARMSGSCREEAPKHTMPFPYPDFDCKKYIILPADASRHPKEILKELLVVVLNKNKEIIFGLVNCVIKIEKISETEKGSFEVDLSLLCTNKDGQTTNKKTKVLYNFSTKETIIKC